MHFSSPHFNAVSIVRLFYRQPWKRHSVCTAIFIIYCARQPFWSGQFIEGDLRLCQHCLILFCNCDAAIIGAAGKGVVINLQFRYTWSCFKRRSGKAGVFF